MADNKILTDEQYKILLEGETFFEQFERVQYFPSTISGFLGKLRDVHNDFYRSPLNVNCGSCVGQALSKLWYHMGVKKGVIDKIEAERLLKLKEDEQASKAGNRKGK